MSRYGSLNNINPSGQREICMQEFFFLDLLFYVRVCIHTFFGLCLLLQPQKQRRTSQVTSKWPTRPHVALSRVFVSSILGLFCFQDGRTEGRKPCVNITTTYRPGPGESKEKFTRIPEVQVWNRDYLPSIPSAKVTFLYRLLFEIGTHNYYIKRTQKV